MTSTPPIPTCPNPACENPHVIRNGSHNGRRHYHCRGCGRFCGRNRRHADVWSAHQGLRGGPRAVDRDAPGKFTGSREITGHKYETIGQWLRRASEHAEALTPILTQDLHLSLVEIDEFWSFVRKKTGQQVKPMVANAGDVSCKIGPAASLPPAPAVRISDDLVEKAVNLTVTRTQARPLNWCSDGWRGYAAILTRAYRQPLHSRRRGRPPLVVPAEVRLTQTVKHRDEHGKLLSVEIRAVLGKLITQAGTVHIERVNGALRDRLNALTRKTYAEALRDATWDALIHLQLFEHNRIRPHQALRLPMNGMPQRYPRRTPAMALRLTDHPWS